MYNGGDTEELVYLLERSILPMFEQLAFGITLDKSDIDRRLSSFDLRVLTLASHASGQWTTHTAPALMSSNAFGRIVHLYRHIIRAGAQRSLTFPALLRSLHSAIHFYFDFAALLGCHFINPLLLEGTSFPVQFSEPGYRATSRWESYSHVVPKGVPATAHGVLNVSLALEALACPRAKVTRDAMLTIIALLAGWADSPESATRSLLRDQIAAAICPRLTEIWSAISHSLPRSQALVSLAVAFLDECRSKLPHYERRQLRDILAGWPEPDTAPVWIPGNASVGVLLVRDTFLSWDLGLPSDNGQSQSLALLEAFIDSYVRFIPTGTGVQTFTFTDNLAVTPRGFGRGIGLAIFHGADVSFLRLPFVVSRMLHPRGREAAGSLQRVAEAISPTTTDELSHVSWGIEDVLGRGGPEMFSNSEWLALFGHSS
jgi:hypothetical protein